MTAYGAGVALVMFVALGLAAVFAIAQEESEDREDEEIRKEKRN